ncbi:IQ domain-containing protein M [Acropora cervicornis]|uniref:IQ domain-containing protein M n=1 Tax=Acropora cervicornis TaxID=6130 RepID=A0AAD9QLQ1_ACRCE|nr:IQ domain-containing protein M [Acropora cervicornis]
MERDLRTLRRSKLMNYSEFRIMTTALEQYYKDVKIAILTGKRETKDLDMRPYLYDEGDPYDKPFYGTLLKMLSEVAMTKYFDKQHEDLLKIYKWYKANKKLITSPPKIPFPSPEKYERSSDGHDGPEDDEQEELEELLKVPKLHLRPKTAPSVEGRKGVRYVTWNKAQLLNRSKRPLSVSKATQKQQRDDQSKDSLSRSLHISCYGVANSSSGSSLHQDFESGRHVCRPGTAPAIIRSGRGRINYQQLKSLILEPGKSSSAPYSSPVVSPPSSPRDTPVATRARSPLSAHFTPYNVKEPPLKLSPRVAKDNVVSQEAEIETSDGNGRENNRVNTRDKVTNKTDAKQKIVPHEILKDASPSLIENILENQKKEEALLEEQHEFLQAKLAHDYDNYVDALSLSQERTRDSGIVNSGVTLKKDVQNSGIPVKFSQDKRETVQVSPVGVYDLSAPEIVPSYSTQMVTGEVCQTTALNDQAEVVKVDAVLGLATPIGAQMEHDRGRVIKEEIASSGQLQSIISIPFQTSLSNAVFSSPVREVSVRTSYAGNSSVKNFSVEDAASEKRHLSLFEQGISSHQYADNREPKLSSERNPRDYTVHFPQEKPQEPTATKSYKTSGPVIPDTIRYQWTDDGFGHRTYLKKLKEQALTSPRITGKKAPTQPTFQVTMPTGSRSLDKRTLASLVLVRHLGEADRRNIDLVSAPQTGGKLIFGPTHDHTVADYSYSLEYMPICQPVGPRLAEGANPSTVNWYLQGEHGLFREPSKHHTVSRDHSLMVEGHHVSSDDKTKEQRSTREQKVALLLPEFSLDDSSGIAVTKSKDTLHFSSSNCRSSPLTPSSARPSSPRPLSSSRVSSPCSLTGARPSWQSSASSQKRAILPDLHQLGVIAVLMITPQILQTSQLGTSIIFVGMKKIFRGYMARRYLKQLQISNVERQRKAAITLQSNFRGFLTRKRQMEKNLGGYTPSSRDLEWARKQSREAEKKEQQIKQVQAHQHIFEVFHPTPNGPTKAQKKAAAITIQRYFRGWFVRRMFVKSKEKALKRTLSFNKFIKGYQALLYRIQHRYGIREPSTALEFNELMEYVERVNNIKKFFDSVGHVPSQKEIDDAIEIVTKMSAKGRSLTKAEAVEVLFQIYVPKGTKLNLANIRKSTWLNPLDNGRDLMQLLSKKDLEQTNLLKCFEVVASSGRESNDIKSLLQPESAKPTEKKQDGKKKASSVPPTRKTVLAQYPMRPSTPRSKFPRPPSSQKPRKR